MDIVTLGSNSKDIVPLLSGMGAVFVGTAIVVYIKRFKANLRNHILQNSKQE